MPLRRLDVVANPVTTVDEFLIDENDILVDPTTGLPMASWSNLGTVVNKIDVQYDFNEATRPFDFARRRFYTAEASVDRYTAQPPLTAECRGIHTSLDGGAIMDRLALLYLQRWGYPPPILIFSITYRRHMFEALDTIRVTHSKIPNCITGVMGLDAEPMEILSVSPTWGLQGRLDITAVWIGAIETSAVPVATTSSLVPGESTVDATDTNIPFGTSITLTTPGTACTQFRVGLKTLNYRVWRLHWDVFGMGETPGKDLLPECGAQGTSDDERVYNSKMFYHIEYKVSTAPDVMGGGNPVNGWVELLPSTERGNTSNFSSAGCGGTAARPAEDVWTHFFGDEDNPILGVPAIYNVKIYFDTVTVQGDPHPAPHTDCGTPFCVDIYTSSVLQDELKRMTADFIEAII